MNKTCGFLYIADYDVKQNVVQTKEIQEIFDEADRLGGLTVVFPKGTFITGTIDIKGASVYMEKGSIWKGSDNFDDYYDNGFVHNEMHQTISMIYSMNHDNISITGFGMIDLNGEAFYDMEDPSVPDYGVEFSDEQKAECPRRIRKRPTQPMFFYNCRNIVMDGISICNAPCWTMSFNSCEDIRLTYLNIRNAANIPNNDGMHFCGSRNVIIHGCNIVSGDDCIALSSITDWNRPCENFVISDCVMSSSSKTIVLGYSHSIVRNVTISNCVIYDSHRGICIMTIPKTGLIEHVLIQNVRIETRVRAGNWWGNGEPIAIIAAKHELPTYEDNQPLERFDISIRDVQINQVSCLGENVIAIVDEDECVDDISFDGIYFEKKESKCRYLKGDRRIDASPSEVVYELPEKGEFWFYQKGGKNVTYKNVEIKPYNGEILQAISEAQS